MSFVGLTNQTEVEISWSARKSKFFSKKMTSGNSEAVFLLGVRRKLLSMALSPNKKGFESAAVCFIKRTAKKARGHLVADLL